ncbi:MAG: DUF3817 domain-containing protein [Acidimicrobiales bacterium]
MTPLRIFRFVSRAEAVTWALLLVGMFLKYVSGTTDAGVRVAGMIHGVVFLGYAVVALTVAVDRRWPFMRVVFALAAAVPPFATLVFDRHAENEGWLGYRWRLLVETPANRSEQVIAWLLHRPVRGVVVAVGVVAAFTEAALLAGSSS